MERYKQSWYNKRINQNKEIKKHLVEIIEKHKEKNFTWSKDDLMLLNYEDLLEIAIVSVNKEISITLGAGSDVSNGKDAKFSVVRKNGGQRNPQYSALIPGCENKEHILACIYEGMQNKFYYFSFPATCKQHSIPFDRTTGEPKRNNYMWAKYECATFIEMALS
jgi:hypothetical protein